MYQLLLVNKWSRDVKQILYTSDKHVITLNKLKLFLKYFKYFKHCPSNYLERKMFRNVLNKLDKELHGQCKMTDLSLKLFCVLILRDVVNDKCFIYNGKKLIAINEKLNYE